MPIRKLIIWVNDDEQLINLDLQSDFSALELTGMAEYLRIKAVKPFFTDIEREEKPEEEGEKVEA